MSTLSRPTISHNESGEVLELHNGDRMNREEFHRAYLQTPENFKAELIGGIVYVASPLTQYHGVPHASLVAALVVYKAATPGVQTGDNVTVQLGYDAEPQPDIYLRVLPEYGGQSRNSEDGKYVDGPPELIVEIALTSRAIDLHAKRADYLRNGVKEYIVASVSESEFRWFDIRDDRELVLDADKVCRSRTFPGLWLDSDALFAGDDAKLLATLQKGLATPEHSEFVTQLAAVKK